MLRARQVNVVPLDPPVNRDQWVHLVPKVIQAREGPLVNQVSLVPSDLRE